MKNDATQFLSDEWIMEDMEIMPNYTAEHPYYWQPQSWKNNYKQVIFVAIVGIAAVLVMLW